MVASLLEKDTNCVLVADLDNTVVGFMLGFVVRHFFSPDPADLFASDVALYVHPTHRGGSIGLRLIKAFEKRTGCAVLINTSFNVRGEPIVCTPEDAYRCFMRTNIDVLVIGPFVLEKSTQPEWKETSQWQQEFQLD